MSHRLVYPAVAAAALAALAAAAPGPTAPEVRMSRFFKVDVTNKAVLGPAPHIPGTLSLNLVSVSVDQPQFWPNEQVHLKVLMPGRPGAKFTASLQKRDAAKQDAKGELDGQGVAVLTLLDGAQKKLELGEYRVDVRTEDGRASGSTTFAVIEGALGAVSLAHEFKQVTSVEELDRAKGAWFMGNAAGAGKRWGNGLSFKNELRVANQPYDGEVKCISRCMLPGCNGVQAGTPKTLRAVKGQIAGTMEVGGHSGPFQIEFVTPKGSLRHQFEGSSHVEREMLLASGGVTWVHHASLAPYEKTVPVPGRQLFVEKQRAGNDPFELDSIIARHGELTLRVLKDVAAPALIVWAPRPDGSFEPQPAAQKGAWKAGQDVVAKIATPYSVVSLGGFVGGQFKEGWAIALVPAELKPDLEVPVAGAPGSTVKIGVTVKDEAGLGAAVSGVLEVYDNRVASRSPMTGLASALGDSVRSTSASVSTWEDRTGIDERALKAQREAEELAAPEPEPEMKMMAKDEAPAPSKPRRAGVQRKKVLNFGSAGGKGGRAGSSAPAGVEPEEEEQQQEEEIREGERKVVFCDVVRTDVSGRTVVEVQLPPQIGRVSVRFVAVRGLDHAAVTKGLDVAKRASAEASLPKTFVPGAQLQVPVTVSNTLQESVTLTVSGGGMQNRFTQSVAPGTREVDLAWAPTQSGSLRLELTSAKGKALDKRELAFQSLASQRVTFSRLVVAGKEPIAVGEGETARVYPGPGALLKGIVLNLVTTMESWFGHAEALSAQVAAKAVILSAISRKVLDDEGLSQGLRNSLDKAVRDLDEAFLDGQTGLIRPYPGVPANPLWSAWVSANLHRAVRVLKADPALGQSMAQTIAQAAKLAARLDAALEAQGFDTAAQGYDAQGQEVIPVEVDGKVVYRVLTDDAVSRWLTGKLLPTVDLKNDDLELGFGKAYDTFRFLRAFQRVGALQYLTEAATALWLKGDRAAFDPLFARLTRGMILAQEPGMVQGPAALGGVYSAPMAMVRFLELLVAMETGKAATGAVTVRGARATSQAALGAAIRGAAGTTLLAPAGTVLRIDREGTVPLFDSQRQLRPLATAAISPQRLGMAGEAALQVTLDPSLDPLEYYAIVAVPTVTAIKQTEDILSDYKGVLLYGQQGLGASKMQVIAVPFRGARTLRLVLEGAWVGSAPGAVAIRHLENPSDHGALALPPVTVKGP